MWRRVDTTAAVEPPEVRAPAVPAPPDGDLEPPAFASTLPALMLAANDGAARPGRTNPGTH